MDWTTEIADRVAPVATAAPLEGTPLVLTLVLAGAAIAVEPPWRLLRVAITLVHELGHAFVGILAGRRFTGFVVRGDMSGHAVTVGPARGPGRVVTTWAGYPAPAVVGAAMVVVAERGWAAPLLTAVLVLLLIAATRIRSALTLGVMAVTLAGVVALWWWRDDTLQAHLLVGTGIVLIVGGWRHLGAVAAAGRRDRGSDPAVLAQLTGVPRLLWLLSFVVVLAAASALAAQVVLDGLPG